MLGPKNVKERARRASWPRKAEKLHNEKATVAINYIFHLFAQQQLSASYLIARRSVNCLMPHVRDDDSGQTHTIRFSDAGAVM